MKTPTENWSTGDAYEYFMGRWSRQIAGQFVKWLKIHSDHQIWIDLGSGTGALTETIQSTMSYEVLIAVDASFDFLTYAKHKMKPVQFMVSDAQALAVKTSSVDVVLSGLALNFVPNISLALREITRSVKSNGVVGAYLWDYADKMEFLRYFWDSAISCDESATSFHEGFRFPICQPDVLEQLWLEAGLKDVFVTALDITTHFDTFDQYWNLFTSGGFPAPHYVRSLNTVDRSKLRQHLQDAVPIQDDGSINLIARAWGVQGIKS